MARRSGSSRQTEDTDLNLTPMLDVVFILLIFFIVTAVFVKEPGIDPDRPEVVDLQPIRPTILIAISENDEVWVNRREVQLRQLRPLIEDLRSDNPQGEAVVQGDVAARYSVVHQVMQTLQETGVPAQYVSVED